MSDKIQSDTREKLEVELDTKQGALNGVTLRDLFGIWKDTSDELEPSSNQLEPDTRAKLEEDIHYRFGIYGGSSFLDEIFGWLDRQVAITEREIAQAEQTHTLFGMTFEEVRTIQAENAELQAKVDNQREALKRFNEMFNLCEWFTDDDGHYTYMSGSEMHLRVSKAEKKAENEREYRMKIKAERDELETKLNEVTGNFGMAMSCKRKWRDRYYELQAKHKLPYGVEWPKFEDGTPVNIGDEVLFDGHTNNVYEIIFFADGTELGLAVDNRPKPSLFLHYGEKAKRPEQEDSIEHVLADLRNNGIDSIADRIERLVK